MEAGTELKLHAAFGEAVADGAGIRDRAREPVELRHHQRVAAPYGRERLIEAGSGSVRAGKSPIRVDAIRRDAELCRASCWAARSCFSVEQRA